MSQTAVIFGSLFVAFVVYVTLRGQLPAYAAVFLGGSGGSGTPAPNVISNPGSPAGQQFYDQNATQPTGSAAWGMGY
jgi:hypothetical protein